MSPVQVRSLAPILFEALSGTETPDRPDKAGARIMASTEPAQKPGSHRRFLSDQRSGLDPFRPLEPECRVVQFSHLLSPDDLRKAGELLRPRPDVQLYVYGVA